MDVHVHENGTSTAERVQKREELRLLIADVGTLPETQRSALLLREIEQLSYEEIAQAMETTIPAVKSLLVRARITLAESSEARALTCDEVRVTLAEVAEGLCKADGPVRKHVRSCKGCKNFRNQLRSDSRALAALFPIGPLVAIKHSAIAKLFGGAGGGSAGTTAGAGGAGAAAGTSAATGGISGLGGLGAIGGAIGGKAAAGMATAALLTAGAVEVRQANPPLPDPVVAAHTASPPAPTAELGRPDRHEFTALTTRSEPEAQAAPEPEPARAPENEAPAPTEPAPAEPAEPEKASAPAEPAAEPAATADPSADTQADVVQSPDGADSGTGRPGEEQPSGGVGAPIGDGTDPADPSTDPDNPPSYDGTSQAPAGDSTFSPQGS
jgi:hypothetical protein